MKKLLIFSFLIISLIATMGFSCSQPDSKSSASNTSQAGNSSSSVTATITPANGASFNWSNSPRIPVTVLTPGDQDTKASNMPQIVMVVGNSTAPNGSAMSLTFPGVVGTITLGYTGKEDASLLYGASYSVGDGKTFYNGVSGTITVTNVSITGTSTRYAGTFSYTSKPTTNQPNLASGTVKGTFDVVKK